MRVLVACEFSGRVRDAFRARGHDAWSCDLLPTEVPGPHYQVDVRDVLDEGWDLMIAHPPCQFLCRAGIHWNSRRPDRAAQTEDALAFVVHLLEAPIPRIAVENPIGVIASRVRKPDQTVQPWQFGHPESKATCLWLKGLPRLQPTDVLPMPESGHWENQTASGQNKHGPSADRWKIRSRTYEGFAAAMAAQWGQ